MDIRSIGSVVQSGPSVSAAQDVSQSPSPTPTPERAATGAESTSGSTATSASGGTEPSADQVSQAVKKINSSLASQSQGIEFSMDNSSHRIVVKIVDQQTNQVISQIPSKQALAIAESIDQSDGEQTQGLLIKQQA